MSAVFRMDRFQLECQQAGGCKDIADSTATQVDGQPPLLSQYCDAAAWCTAQRRGSTLSFDFKCAAYALMNSSAGTSRTFRGAMVPKRPALPAERVQGRALAVAGRGKAGGGARHLPRSGAYQALSMIISQCDERCAV